MSADTLSEVSTAGAAALVQHLRLNPDHARRSPSELAEKFGLDARFVEQVLSGLEDVGPSDRDAGDSEPWYRGLQRLSETLGTIFARITARPIPFLISTTLTFLVAVVVIMAVVRPESGTPPDLLSSGLIGSIAAATFTLQAIAYYRWKMTRFAIYGGLIFYVCFSIAAMVVAWAESASAAPGQRFIITLVLGLAMLLVALLYTGFAFAFTLVGGYLELRHKDRLEKDMTRQEMLERYFELQRRLQTTERRLTEGPEWENWTLVRWFRAHPYLMGALIALGSSLANLIVVRSTGFSPRDGNLGSFSQIFSLFFVSLSSFIMFGTHLLGGFLQIRFVRATMFAAATIAGGSVVALFPWAPEWMRAENHLGNFVFGVVLTLVLTWVGALGGLIQQRASREKALVANDPAALTREMLRLQMRLADHVSDVCVMVVDAAKSSLMKASADPLAVEFSFRGYQEWLEKVSARFGGRVHSTAGDGAVIAFDASGDALMAAKEIQRGVPGFNREVNRLPSPFRLRIGLHCGPVAGDLDDIQFSQVIDIAAHVQDVAPIGGIAVTSEVAKSLPDEKFLPLAVESDGYKVLLSFDIVDREPS